MKKPSVRKISRFVHPNIINRAIPVRFVAMDGFAQAHVFAQSQCSHCVQFVLDIHPRGVHLAEGPSGNFRVVSDWEKKLPLVRPDVKKGET